MQPSTVHLAHGGRSRHDVLVLGDAVLLGAAAGPREGDGGLASELVARGVSWMHGPVALDAAWDLRAALKAATRLASTGRLHRYDSVVLVTTADQVLTVSSRLPGPLLRKNLLDGPPVVIVLAAAVPDGRRAAEAASFLRALVRSLGLAHQVTILPPSPMTAEGLAEPAAVAVMTLACLRAPLLGDGGEAADARRDQLREVAVDQTATALHGRTHHLRRAVEMVQHSFDVPFAQLNLVSHGTLRSLAYIGRSSNGLQQSLSAEAARQTGPLLVPDTRATDRFTTIPETHGPGAIRYFAGHPVHDDHGHRIGVLCALDVEPRPVLPGDAELIRDIALLAEGELSLLLTPPAM